MTVEPELRARPVEMRLLAGQREALRALKSSVRCEGVVLVAHIKMVVVG